jgi:pimeloyl-ACP methyl ester carboxylesterase
MPESRAHATPSPDPARRALARLALGGLAIAALLYALACAWLYASQRGLLYYPVRTSAANLAAATALPGRDVRVLFSARASERRDAVVYFGGNAEDVAGALPDLADAFPGHALYALHYRGYAGSAGTPTEAALAGDALALADRVRRAHPRVVLVGRSLGSGLAMQVAAQRPVERLVLVTPYDSIANVGQAHYPWLPVRWLARDRYDSAALAARVRAPVRVLTARFDQVIPRGNTQALVSAFAPGQVEERVFDAGHNDISAAPGYDAALAAP